MRTITRLAAISTALFFLCSGISVPVAAQPNQLQRILKKLWIKKNHALAPQVSKELPLTRQAMEAMISSRISNRGGWASVAPLLTPRVPHISPRPLLPPPPNIKKAVFTLQHSPQSHGKGSAFAVNIDGEIWGVTARHVLDDIGRSPFMAIPGEDGAPQFFQVFSAREGNVHGADIAIFRIPPAALKQLVPLEPDYTLPAAQAQVQSAGFSHGNFGWFARIGILFSSEHRILARYEDFPVRNGYCGSPLLKNGKAVGVFVGMILPETIQAADWLKWLSENKRVTINPFNQIVPIAWIRVLASQAKDPSLTGGVPLKLLGKTLGILHADENIHSIQQLRNGRLIKTIYSYPFLDYAHLERFLNVGPDDTIRIVVQQGDRSSIKRSTRWYEWNISSATMKKMEQ